MKYLKKIIPILLVLVLLSPALLYCSDHVDAKKYVKGYYRKDGTYVSGYWRGSGSSSSSYSYSTSPGRNTEPVTGTSFNQMLVVNLYKGTTYEKSISTSNLVFVQGYYRKDGTYVRPHYRTTPNDFLTDNFSYLGLSTLEPLQKPFINNSDFQYNVTPTISLIEKYLGYQAVNQTLTTDQLNNLKDYAIHLNYYDEGIEDRDSIINHGIFYYQSMGISPELGKGLATFNIEASYDPQSYIDQILISNGIYNLNNEDIYLKNAYILALTGGKQTINQSFYIDKALNIGKFFYTKLGLYNPEEQVEMDMLQDFSSLDKSSNLISTIKDLNTNYIGKYSTNMNDTQKYLVNVIPSEFKKNIGNFDSIGYSVSLSTFSGTLFSYDLNKGIEYYTKAKFDNEQITKQITQDIILFFHR
ncbi:hypothetical protein M3629_07095 [Paenibacillus polysaccharolyticus]|uniref:hypothetical protein n=1 Tax=Paenibacillus polysaccharolyticus TaxID=582692 RepID=UPI00203F2F0E|nr:hypothetical protein [Paenibacillus polysaccharolyticus]MCM3132546.1 hypothetical protein [Paenibacillus polysaccharolyticus]